MSKNPVICCIFQLNDLMWNWQQHLLPYGFPLLGQLGNFPVKVHSPCSRKHSSKDISVFEMLRKAPLETWRVFFGTRPGEHPRLIPAATMIHSMWRSAVKKSVEEELLVGLDCQWSGDARTYSVQTFQSSFKSHWLVAVETNRCSDKTQHFPQRLTALSELRDE